MMWWQNDMGWGGWVVATLTMVAFWSLVVFAVLAIFRGDRDHSAQAPQERAPQQILAERFARGELDEAEYRARQQVLQTSRDPNRPLAHH